MFFDSIKFRLPSVQNWQSPFLFPLLFFFWIKVGTRISVGEISQNHQLQTLSWSLPQHVAHHRRSNTLKIRTDGIQRRMTEPLVQPNDLWFPQLPLLPLQTMVCTTLPSNSFTLEFKQIACWSLKLNSMNLCQFALCTPCASMNKLAYSLFLAFFQVLVNIYPHRDPMLSK